MPRSVMHFQAEIAASSTKRWVAPQFPQDWHVIWTVVPLAPVQDAQPQLESRIYVERQSAEFLKYYVEVQNYSTSTVQFQMRYTVLNN